jgi:hypothetical protein
MLEDAIVLRVERGNVKPKSLQWVS